MIADALHDLDFRVDSPDFDLVVVESASVSDLVMRGDVDACICLPDFSVSDLADGRLRPLYGGKSAAEIYAGDVMGEPGALPVADALIVDKQWLAQNRDAVEALLGLWEVGLQNWASQKEQLVADYPHLLSVQSDEDIAWMTNYVKTHDWVLPSVYLTQEDSRIQTGIFARMQSLGPGSRRCPRTRVGPVLLDGSLKRTESLLTRPLSHARRHLQAVRPRDAPGGCAPLGVPIQRPDRLDRVRRRLVPVLAAGLQSPAAPRAPRRGRRVVDAHH